MQVKKYFEKKVSLLSTSDVRYDGELYTVDPSEQSIALKHVNCMGTEGRRTGDQAIAPSDCTYEFIIFRAVNIRELWLLDEQNRRKRDLTQEILEPLRQGQSSSYSQQKQRQDNYDNADSQAPKRKVGYQSRSGQAQQSQGQQYSDPYYQQPPAYDHGGLYQGYGGRGQPPPPYGDESSYPPLPNQPSGYYAPPPQNYYEPQNQGYYGQGGGQVGYGRRNYGYQRQRAPQYYNQQRAPQHYNNSGYHQSNQGYYNQGRRYPQQYNRNYYNNNYNRNYGQHRGYNRGNRRPQQRGGGGGERGGGSGSNNISQAGTGAFLDNRRLRGDEIEIKDQQDFDFGAAKNEFDLNQESTNGVAAPLAAGPEAADSAIAGVALKGDKDNKDESAQDKDNSKEQDKDNKDAQDQDKTEDAAAAADVTEDKKDSQEQDDQSATDAESKVDDKKKYDRSKSFFDALATETKSKQRQDMQTQKDVDSKTFGPVAAAYKSRHINMMQRNRNQQHYQQRNNYRQNNNYHRGYQPRNNNNYRQQPHQHNYTTNKWVVRR